MRIGLVQLTSSDDPGYNLEQCRDLVHQAAAGGAEFILTPEVTNCVSGDRAHQNSVLHFEEDDPTLAAMQYEARTLGVWILLGSLALKTHDPDGRLANRSFMISPRGDITARYDKIHMFDVNVTARETFRESAGFRPGSRAVLAQTDFGKVGMSICYDVRFAHLHRALAAAGARILTIPAAFSPVTGAAHWEVLLRARAIETGCFVLAPAQTGTHDAGSGPQRKTWGHSMAIAPWGEVLIDAGIEKGVSLVDLDLSAVEGARNRVPALTHDRDFEGP